MEKKSGERPKSRKGQDIKSNRTRQKRTREEIYIEKWDQTDSSEIPERGETSEIPDLSSGEGINKVLIYFVFNPETKPIKTTTTTTTTLTSITDTDTV